MALPTGLWQLNGNGFKGDLNIQAVDAQGNLNGTVYGQQILGFWDEGAQKITFMRIINPNDPSTFQIFTGFMYDSNAPLFGEAGNPPNPQNFKILNGFFEAFGGTGAVAQRVLYGWMARKSI
jgi:hypothetical protein